MALTARKLQEIEKTYPEGLSSKQILAVLDEVGEPLTEATLRKYVQLGLLPRSRRVGQKGKHRGSRGIYPVEVIRRVDEIRRAMDQGDTLEELARAAQAVRAKLALVRVSMEEVLEAAESDFGHRELDRKSKGPLRTELNGLKKDAKAWLKSLERWSGEVDKASQKNAPAGGKTPARAAGRGKTTARKTAAKKAERGKATRKTKTATKGRKSAAAKAASARTTRRKSAGSGRKGTGS